jgi:hypothetical protein
LNAESLQQSETTWATRTSRPYLYLPALRPSFAAHFPLLLLLLLLLSGVQRRQPSAVPLASLCARSP